ncbi:MAG: AMP-binding protein [Lachnospiraceae bacterium]|nr:AMP-binding protein [Lachnospiraceae bacterium]
MNREVREIVNYNCQALEESAKNFEAIYKVMFRLSDNVLAETNDGYQIQTYTYGEIRGRIERAAAALYGRIGATHKFVGLEMENCVEWIVAFWAILRSGNRPYLINCRHPKALCQGICDSLKIKYIIGNHKTELNGDYIDITAIDSAASAMSDNKESSGAEEIAGKGLGSVPEKVFENVIALSTSATTLHEVVCYYSGKEFSEQLLNTQGILKQNERISLHYHGYLKQLAFLPFYHIFGLSAVYFWFTYFGRTLVFMKDYAPDTILNTVRKHEVTHVFGVPMLWHEIDKQLRKHLKEEGGKKQKKFEKGLKICTALQNAFPYAGTKLSKKIMHEVTDQLFGPSVQFCISGGSYLKDSTMELFNGIGYPLHNGYGMSEIGITSVELRDHPKERNKNSIGKPFSCVEYRLSDQNTLQVKGDTICYAMMIDGVYKETEEWFETGDIMEMDADGSYYIRGRLGDSVIGENGENINPDMIEQSFQLTDAKNLSVLGIPNKDEQGEVLSMIVEISPYLSPGRIQGMIDTVYQINGTLPMTSRVQKFYFTYQAIAPATAIKVGRQYVLRGLEAGSIELIPFSEIRSSLSKEDGSSLNPELVKRVTEIVAEVLDLAPEEIDINAHVMNELGAGSLEYFDIMEHLSQEFSVFGEFSEDEYTYTIREFCEYLEEHIE